MAVGTLPYRGHYGVATRWLDMGPRSPDLVPGSSSPVISVAGIQPRFAEGWERGSSSLEVLDHGGSDAHSTEKEVSLAAPGSHSWCEAGSMHPMHLAGAVCAEIAASKQKGVFVEYMYQKCLFIC